IFTEVRGISGVKEAVYQVGDVKLRTAVVSGLKNAADLIEKLRSGEVQYDFIEVMACPGGCVNGGGQPHQKASVRMVKDIRQERALNLYRLDKRNALHKSHENPEVQQLYTEYLGEYGSEKAHAYLHTQFQAKGE
ncbi:MAG: iron hydrogenase small subunit, partial [Agathobacter sp.]